MHKLPAREPPGLPNANPWRRFTPVAAGMELPVTDLVTDEPPTPLKRGLDQLEGVRCYGWGSRPTRGAWSKIIVNGTSKGWRFTDDEEGYDSETRSWRSFRTPAKKPGLTSLTSGDVFTARVDTTLPHLRSESYLQLTYLQSYEHVGVLRLSCSCGCRCAAKFVDTLLPGAKLATLNTTTLRASASANCCVSFENVSPKDGKCALPSLRGPCLKIKLVSLTVSAFVGNSTADPAAAGGVQFTADDMKRMAEGLPFEW